MGKGLIDEVFSWSLSDILDEELYKEKVEKIPDSFQAVDQYFASFVYPLLEETRAQLASSLEKVSRAPYAQVTYFDSTKQNGKLYYDIEVDYWRNRCGVDGERSYRTFAGDYFVFTDAKPEAVSDLPQLERGWALLSKITENKNGDGHTLTFLRVLSSKEIQVKLSSGRPLFIVFLMNMRTNERIWNSLQMGGNMNVIKQILCSPTQASARAGFGRSLFERLISIGHSKHILDMQYRMHPLISLLPNSEFYGNQILDAPNVKNKRHKKCIRLLPLFGPYSFINVSCGREEMDSFTCSFKNMVEVAMVTKIIRKLFKAWGKSKEMLSVGIVATYTAQVIAIKEKVGQKYDSFDRFSLKVSTIDGFQGGEEDVIIFSTVRSNAKGSVGDISNRQRTNVALTRARCCLWIVGDGRTLFDSNTVWKSIVQDAKDRNCFYNAEEDEDLADVVLEVKKEMDQLDDFLNADSLLFKNARWKKEKDIIEFSGSSFILGRSGTGKTTVLIMKLVQKEQLYHLAAEGFHKVESNSSASSTLRKDNAGSEVEIKGNILRQIFVTVNVKLCYAVRQYISRLKRSMCGCNSSAEGFQSNLDDIDEASQFSDIPDSFSDIPLSSYPLVITFNKFLMMLDGTVGRSFFGRFLEFMGLSQEKRKGSRSMALKTFIRTKEVHYDKFCSAYWPHFSVQLTKKLDPSTIFAEIVSHIKGGSCVGVQDDKLSREDYISYSRRRLSHLSEQERAQTIVRGVDFRFKDIKALFYREFTACERNGKGQVSDIFNLSQNFRSHAGVLKLANSVLNLLYHFFPSSVDRLQPETSLVNGEEPVWVQMRNGENTLCSFFKSSGSFDRGIFGFGAEQVILVRDDSHRNEVLNYVGKQALVLTLTECKGLEFQDVLLYNFFSSSPLKDQWEVIYGYMKEQNLIDSPLLKSFPIFNEGKHISLCLELKQLYVAITRTRKRLWIFESRFCSMFNYWEKLHLVQISELEYNFLQEIQVASSQREWKARGMKFFYQQNYDKARFCFEKAGESYLEKWAVAAGSVSTADQMRDSNPKMADIHLTEAAHIYESIGKNESAALCFFELREYEKAGIIYLEKCGESKLEEAGECFYSAGCYKRAAEIYARCNLFSKCLSACADGKLFEVGYDFIQLWKENKFLIGQGFLESEELQKFLERGALYFQKLQDSESMMKFVKDFQSENLMRTFLKSVDCLDELVLLEKERGNFLEAANVANKKGDILLGVDLLQMGRRFKEASGVILSYVLYNSLWVHGSKGWPLKQFEKKEELLIKAKTYAENVSQHYHNFVCIEADILSHGKSSLFTMEKNWGDSARHGSFRGKILGARKILDAYLYQGTPQHENEVYLVEDLIKYTQNKKSREKTSVGGIVYYWNFWKEEIENILSSIQDTKEDSYSEFCLNYFGVSKQLKNEKTVYLLLYPDAEWVKGANLRNIKRGNSIWIDADQFVWSAIRYWSSEMLTVGVKVLEILEAFYVFSVDNALSLNCKTMLLIEIFRVSKSLIESKFLNHRDSSNILQRFLEIPIKNFFGHIYPLDWRMPMTKDMIYLRDTELSRNLLREVVYRIIRSRAIANGQLGMLMTIILSGKFSTNLYMQIATTLGDNISWKEFIENFIQTKSNDNSIEDPSDFDLVVKFHRALADIEYTDFSPSVFLYLVDRLLILVSYLKGYFFTTKSSLVEWLMSRGWNTETNLDYLSDVQVQPLLEETVGFVAHTVNKLICSEPLKWIKRYNLKMEFYPLLVLRLFVVLCLLCINFDGYYGLLFNLLDKREVTSLLPWKFYKSLWRLREHEKAHINIKVVSEALKDSFGGGISLKINHQEIPSASSFVTTSDPVKAQQTNRNFWAMLGTVEFNPLTDASWLMEMILEYVLLVNATMRCCRRGNCCHSSGSAAGMVNKVCDELQQLYSALDSRNIRYLSSLSEMGLRRDGLQRLCNVSGEYNQTR
ncbi:hypothetical protein GH714_001200 [Hevea brasiliensis]|uniref:Uncharacterized protein n=1 Tax=Hevea brasiliensis TaxID=3981 RepID=A0A6A6KRH3_HEVBR|nr:hypothetical protein GH714_001200 [Hevea brasiliensis]